MPRQQRTNDESGTSDSEDYDSVSSMADRLGLKGKDKDRYVHNHMTDLGYSSRRSYFKPDEDDDDDDSGGRFRTRSRGNRRNRRDDDDDYI